MAVAVVTGVVDQFLGESLVFNFLGRWFWKVSRLRGESHDQ